MHRRSFFGWLFALAATLLFGRKSEAKTHDIGLVYDINTSWPEWTKAPLFYVERIIVRDDDKGFADIGWVDKNDLKNLPAGEYRATPHTNKHRYYGFLCPVSLIVLAPGIQDQNRMQYIFDNYDMVVGSGKGETILRLRQNGYHVSHVKYMSNLTIRGAK